MLIKKPKTMNKITPLILFSSFASMAMVQSANNWDEESPGLS